MNRKIFFLAAAAVIAAAGFYFGSALLRPSALTPQQRQAIARDQQIFSEWYEDYKYNLSQLDFAWRQYHRILKDFRDEEADAEAISERLHQLKAKQAYILKDIGQLPPPKELSTELYDLSIPLYTKLNAYAKAQGKAVSRSAALMSPANAALFEDKVLCRRLEEICVAETPAALFIASDIIAVRNHLLLPDEK